MKLTDDILVAPIAVHAKPVSARKMRRKLPRGASRLLPFKGRVTWPMPDGAEPIEFAHPPVKAVAVATNQPNQRKQNRTAQKSKVEISTR